MAKIISNQHFTRDSRKGILASCKRISYKILLWNDVPVSVRLMFAQPVRSGDIPVTTPK